MFYVGLCERCGFFKLIYEQDNTCPVCNNTFVDTKLEEEKFWNMSKEEKEQFIREFMGGKELDPYWVNRREAEAREERERLDRFAEEYNRTHPRCPYCQKRDVKKISSGSRLLSVGFWGLGSGKIGKQWHCNNCNSDF